MNMITSIVYVAFDAILPTVFRMKNGSTYICNREKQPLTSAFFSLNSRVIQARDRERQKKEPFVTRF